MATIREAMTFVALDLNLLPVPSPSATGNVLAELT